MSDHVHTTEAFTGMPEHVHLPCKDVSALALATLRREAATLHAVGYLLVIVVSPDDASDDDERLFAYAVPADTEGLRDAIANAEASE